MTEEQWTQDVSDLYRGLAAIAVPARAEQMAALLTLIPFRQDDRFHVVELSSGEGKLAYALLQAFPNATLLALDYEESLRQEAAQRLSVFGERASIAAYDISQDDWHGLVQGADVVLSSLAIHHLDGAAKQALFQVMAEHLSPRGALLIADLIRSQREEARELFAQTWDNAAARQDPTDGQTIFASFQSTKWNYFRYPDVDDMDKPSPLFDQLLWLQAAGFAVVDCFWMQAGHAIYGGYRSAEAGGGLLFSEAQRFAEAGLKA